MYETSRKNLVFLMIWYWMWSNYRAQIQSESKQVLIFEGLTALEYHKHGAALSYFWLIRKFATYLATFDIFCYHNNSLDSMLPDHSPKVIYCIRKRSLENSKQGVAFSANILMGVVLFNELKSRWCWHIVWLRICSNEFIAYW